MNLNDTKKSFKVQMKKDYHAIIKGLKDGSLNHANILKKYPQAMLLLGTADGAYYRKATGDTQAPNGIYPINNPDEDIYMHDPKEDRLTSDKLITVIKSLLSSFDSLYGDDLWDMMNGNSDNMAGTTTSEWTADHAYYQPDDPLNSKGELKD